MGIDNLLKSIDSIMSQEEDEPVRETPRQSQERAFYPPRPVMSERPRAFAPTPRPTPVAHKAPSAPKPKATVVANTPTVTATPTAEKPSMFARMGGKRRHGHISHAKAVAAGRKGGKKAARNAAKRSRAAKKAAKTRVKHANKRSRIARKAARARHGKR